MPYLETNDSMHTYDFSRSNTDKILSPIVFIHTGAWKIYDKNYHLQELKIWHYKGFACTSINYCLALMYKCPAAIADVQNAIQYFRLHANILGIDPNKIIAIRHSADGHLSAMLGNLEKYIDDDKNEK